MSRKRRISTDREKRVRENDYDDDEIFANDIEIRKFMTDYSEDLYRDTLKIWAQ